MSQHKTVLQLIESGGPGGAETVVLELCKGLDNKNFYPVVGLLHDGWLNQQLRKNGVETIIINNKYSYDPFCLWKLVNIIRKRRVDIIHSHEFMMNVYGTAAALLTRRPNIATIHGKSYYWEKWRRRFACQIIAHFATKIVAVSENLKEFIASKTGMDRNNISVIYNGIDTAKFSGEASHHGVNSESQPEKSPIIGTIGNLYPVKGHIYLIKAASKVVQEFPHATFLIIGKTTKYLDMLKNEVLRLSIGENIKFLGFQENIPQLLRVMDIFVLPSIHETFSISTIEAMAASKPVVATRCGGPEEIIVDGMTGFLVPPMDPESLSEKILILLKNKQLAEKIGGAARKQVEERFAVAAMIQKYQKLYETDRSQS